MSPVRFRHFPLPDAAAHNLQKHGKKNRPHGLLKSSKKRTQLRVRAVDDRVMRHPKPIVLTHRFEDGAFTASEPIIMRWNGVDMPKVLRELKPGQYVLLPFEPPDDILCPAKEAA